MSEKTKKSIRFNLIDVVIILILIGCVVGVFLRLGVKETQASIERPENAVTCTMLISDTLPEYVDYVKQGDVIFNTTTGDKIGTITSVSAVIAERTVELEDGTPTRTKNEARRDITITVDCYCMDKTDGYYIEGTTLCAVGAKIPVGNTSFRNTAAVIDMQIEAGDTAN